MNHSQKTKGFTLVEIIVSIAIFSIVLAILGSIMVVGFKYFYETSSVDLDKRSVDELASYVRNELLYATDVKIINQDPGDGWYSFDVVDGKLHHYDQENQDLNVFNNDDFYNYHSFRLTAKAYENKKRLDLTFTMYDDEDLYTTNDTLELLNVDSITHAPFAESQIIGQNHFKIYYKKDKKIIHNETSNTHISGTVADQVSFMNLESNRGKLDIPDKYSEKKIYKYDLVYQGGYWWMFIGAASENIKGSEAPISDTNKKWKCISSSWHPASGYEAGDIVVYNEKFYKCQMDIINLGNPIFYPDSSDDWIRSFWKEVSEDDLPSDGSTHLTSKVNSYNKHEKKDIIKKYEKTVIRKLKNMDLTQAKDLGTMSQEEIANIPVVTNQVHPSLNEVYKKVEKNTLTGNEYVSYYIKLFSNDGLPGQVVNGQVGWQEIRIDYCDTSAYVETDETYYAIKGQDIYLQCRVNVDKSINMTDFPWGDQRWKIL